MAYAAVLGRLDASCWILLLANVFWALAYDTEYAMVDRDDDIAIGIRTAAITFGRFDVLAVMICYGLALGLIACVGYLEARGVYFYAGLVIAVAIAVYHYTLIRHRDREGCFQAFNHNNWLGAAIFVGLAVDYALT
jgi:4-hydroxybenzoate polyprenyltransferase